MFAVMFEVQPKKERWNDYLELAKYLKPKLEAIDGFIDNERFASRRTAGRLLSLSIWRDEKAVVRWRTQAEHHTVQQKGRAEIFEDYHLRVGEITGDTAPPPGMPLAQQRFDETQVGDAKAVTITELVPAAHDRLDGELAGQLGIDPTSPGLVDREAFESINNPGKLLLLAAWRDAASAARWAPVRPGGAGSLRHRSVRVIRDYGMADRGEAPQFYPAARPAPSESAPPRPEAQPPR